MSSSQRIETIKNWTSWTASVVIIIFSLAVFGGVVNFVMKFLGASSYFSPTPIEETLSMNSVKERNAKMGDFLKERTLKRQEASALKILGESEKDPFNLP